MRRIAESTQPDEQPPPDVDPEAWDDLPMAGKRGALRGWVSHVQVAPVAPGQPRGQHDPDRVYIQPRDEEAFRRAVRRRFVVTEHPLRGQS